LPPGNRFKFSGDLREQRLSHPAKIVETVKNAIAAASDNIFMDKKDQKA
jgi:hypothetical protein